MLWLVQLSLSASLAFCLTVVQHMCGAVCERGSGAACERGQWCSTCSIVSGAARAAFVWCSMCSIVSGAAFVWCSICVVQHVNGGAGIPKSPSTCWQPSPRSVPPSSSLNTTPEPKHSKCSIRMLRSYHLLSTASLVCQVIGAQSSSF